jgi:regulator of sigma E protease
MKDSIGVMPRRRAEGFLNLKHRVFFFEAIPAGISRGMATFSSYLKQLRMIFSPQTGAYKSLGGFITIGSIFPGEWDWQVFWNMTAFLSIVLAIMNILPIPALDGGHVMFLVYEMVAGRKPSDKFMEYAQLTGMLLFFTYSLCQCKRYCKIVPVMIIRRIGFNSLYLLLHLCTQFN